MGCFAIINKGKNNEIRIDVSKGHTELNQYLFDSYNNDYFVPKANNNQKMSMENATTFFDIMDNPETGVNTKDGTAIIKIDKGGKVEIHKSNNEIVEVGNIEDIYDQSIEDYGIFMPEETQSQGNFTYKIGDSVYENRYSNPEDAINYDENGNIESVNLEKVTVKGGYNGENSRKEYSPTLIKGEEANRIAIDIFLEKLKSTDNEKTFEKWVEKEFETGQQDNGEIPPITSTTTTGTDQKIQPPTGDTTTKNAEGQVKPTERKVPERKPSKLTDEKRKEAEKKEREKYKNNKPELKKISSYKAEGKEYAVYDVANNITHRGNMFTVEKNPEGWIIIDANVPEYMQKKGIATEFYKRINKASINATGKPLQSSKPRKILTGEVMYGQNEKSIKLWDKLVRNGDAIKTENGYRFKTKGELNNKKITPKSKKMSPDQKQEYKNKIVEARKKTIENKYKKARAKRPSKEELEKVLSADWNWQTEIMFLFMKAKFPAAVVYSVLGRGYDIESVTTQRGDIKYIYKTPAQKKIGREIQARSAFYVPYKPGGVEDSAGLADELLMKLSPENQLAYESKGLKGEDVRDIIETLIKDTKSPNDVADYIYKINAEKFNDFLDVATDNLLREQLEKADNISEEYLDMLIDEDIKKDEYFDAWGSYGEETVDLGGVWGTQTKSLGDGFKEKEIVEDVNEKKFKESPEYEKMMIGDKTISEEKTKLDQLRDDIIADIDNTTENDNTKSQKENDSPVEGKEITNANQITDNTPVANISKQLFPTLKKNGYKLIWHTKESMAALFGEGNFAVIEGKNIHVRSDARGNSTLHEIFHPIVSDIIFNDTALKEKLLEELQNSNNPQIVKARNFAQQYSEQEKSEEGLTEALANMALDAMIEFSTKSPNLFTKIIRGMLKSFGLNSKSISDIISDKNSIESIGKALGNAFAKGIIVEIKAKNSDKLKKQTETKATISETPALRDVESIEKRSEIKGYDKLKEVEKNGGYIKTDETITDNDYEPSDVEYTRTRAYKVEYVVKWSDNETSSDPDIETFKTIDEAYEAAQKEGEWWNGNVDHLQRVEPVYKEVWLNKDGTEYEENGNIMNGDDFANTKEGKIFIKDFGFSKWDNLSEVYIKDFGKRDENSRKLEQTAWSDLGSDLETSFKADNGETYTIEHSGRGKYSTLKILDKEGNEIDNVQLRIADHTYNPRNNDDAARGGKFISVEIANVNATKDKFRTTYSLQFDGTDTYENILSTVKERLNEILKNKIEYPESKPISINVGTFNPNNNDIRFQKSGEERQIQVNDEKLTVKPINVDVVNGFYSPLEQTIYESKSNLNQKATQESSIPLSLHETEEGTPYLSKSNEDYKFQKESTDEDINYNSVKAIWKKSKDIQFNGTTKVKNAEDVAQIFSLLENKSVEHFFVVHVDKNNNSNIQFLSIGSKTGTVVDIPNIIAGINKFNSKKIYLVHNHPSGSTVPSNADLKLTDAIRNALYPLGINVEHVIMDTYKHEYVYIDESNYPTVLKRGEIDSNAVIKKINPVILSDMEMLREPQTKITDSDKVFTFLQQVRFSALPKLGLLILNGSNNIIANYLLPNGVDQNAIFKHIGESVIGKAIIFYGNSQDYLQDINYLSKVLKNIDIQVLDYVVLSSGGKDVIGYYKSNQDMGNISDVQEKYNTGNVKFQKENNIRDKVLNSLKNRKNQFLELNEDERNQLIKSINDKYNTDITEDEILAENEFSLKNQPPGEIKNRYINRLLHEENDAPVEVINYVKDKSRKLNRRLSLNSMQFMADKIINNIYDKQGVLTAFEMLKDSLAEGVRNTDNNGWEILALRLLSPISEALGEKRLAGEIELYIGNIGKTFGVGIWSLRVLEDKDTFVKISVNKLLHDNEKILNTPNVITGESPLEAIRKLIYGIKPEDQSIEEFGKALKKAFDEKTGEIHFPEDKKQSKTKEKAQKAYSNYKKLLRESRGYLGMNVNPKLFKAGVELMKFAYYSARGVVEDAIIRFNKQAAKDNLGLDPIEIMNSAEFVEFKNDYENELKAEKIKQVERLANKILNPETKTTRAESRLANALRIAKQRKAPNKSPKTIAQDIKNNELNLKELLEAKNIVANMELTENEKQTILNEIDDIIETITQKSIGKSQVRKEMLNGIKDLNSSITDLITDRIKSNEVKKSLLDDIVENTGLSPEDAQKYVDIADKLFDQILAKEIEKKAKKELDKLYRNDVNAAQEKLDQLNNELDALLEIENKTEDDRIKIAEVRSEITKLQRAFNEAKKKFDKNQKKQENLLKKGMKQTPTISRLINLVKNGVLSDDVLANELAEWFGLNPISEEQKNKLESLMIEYETKERLYDKNKAMQELLNYIDELSKKAPVAERFVNIFQEYAFLNMLDSPNSTFAALGGNLTIFITKHLTPDLFIAIKDTITKDKRAFSIFIEGIIDGTTNGIMSGEALKEVMLTGESSHVIFDSDSRRLRAKKYITKAIEKGIRKSIILLNSKNKMDRVRGAGMAIPLLAISATYISSRGLIAADIFTKSAIIPYLRNRNAYYELLKNGYDKNSVDLLQKVNEMVGKNSSLLKAVEEDAIDSGLTGKPLEAYKRRRFYELLPEFAAKDINESSTAMAEEMAMQGEIYGGIGKYLNYLIGYKAKAVQSHSYIDKAAAIGLTVIFPFARVAGIGYNILKSATLFNLMQLQRSSDGKLETKYGLPKFQSRTESRLWASPTQLKEIRELTEYEKMANTIYAVAPTVMLFSLLAMLFKFGHDDDDDIVLLLKNSDYRITGGQIPYNTGKTINGYESYAIQKRVGDTWVTVYKYENNPAGIILSPIGAMMDKNLISENDGIKILKAFKLSLVASGEYIADYGWASSYNTINELFKGIGMAIKEGKEAETKENYHLAKAEKSVARILVPGGAMGSYLEKIAINTGVKTAKSTNGETFFGANVEPIIDPFTGSIYYSWMFNTEKVDAYGQPFTPDINNELLLDAIGNGLPFGLYKDTRAEYVKELQRFESVNLIHMYYPQKGNYRKIKEYDSEGNIVSAKDMLVVKDMPLENQRNITRNTALNVKKIAEENIETLRAVANSAQMNAIQSTIMEQAKSHAWVEDFLAKVGNSELLTNLSETDYTTNPKTLGLTLNNGNKGYYDWEKLIDYLAENDLKYENGEILKGNFYKFTKK